MDIQTEWYSAYTDIAAFSLPLLRQMQKLHYGYPFDFSIDHDTPEEADQDWIDTLGAMIRAFELIAEDNWQFEKSTQNEVQMGVALFGKHFLDLWD